MKQILAFSLFVFTVTIIVTMIMLPAHAVSSNDNKNPSMSLAIPDSVTAILEKSCFPCHSAPGNGMAMMKLDFDKWDTYKPEKQADKAAAMCKKLTKGSMPPSKFRSSNPDKVPTQADVDFICKWAASLEKTEAK
jgi:hypothetical protein